MQFVTTAPKTLGEDKEPRTLGFDIFRISLKNVGNIPGAYIIQTCNVQIEKTTLVLQTHMAGFQQGLQDKSQSTCYSPGLMGEVTLA